MQKAARYTGQVLTIDEARRLLLACREKYVVTCAETSASHPRREAGQEWHQEFAPRQHILTVILVGFLSGLRLGNILGLRWRHLDLGEGVLRIPATEMKNDDDLEVPLHNELWGHLRELLARAKKKNKGCAPHPDDLVIGVKVAEVTKSFRSALRRANLWNKDRPFRAHDMRHSFRTWLAQVKAGDAAEQLLGHKLSGNDVVRRYIHFTLDDLRHELNKLPCLRAPEAGGQEGQAAN